MTKAILWVSHFLLHTVVHQSEEDLRLGSEPWTSAAGVGPPLNLESVWMRHDPPAPPPLKFDLFVWNTQSPMYRDVGYPHISDCVEERFVLRYGIPWPLRLPRARVPVGDYRGTSVMRLSDREGSFNSAASCQTRWSKETSLVVLSILEKIKRS